MVPPPSAFSTSPKVCSLDEDLQGMNLSLQVADLDDGDDDRFDIVRGDLLDIGDPKLLVLDRSFELGGEEKASSRRVVSDIVGGRLIPLFLLSMVVILFLSFKWGEESIVENKPKTTEEFCGTRMGELLAR